MVFLLLLCVSASYNESQPFNGESASYFVCYRAGIREAAFELTATKTDAKAAFHPALNITAGIGLQAFKPGLLLNGVSIAYNVLGKLSAPLINRSVIKAESGRASALQLEALYRYQKSIVKEYVETDNEIMRINNLQKQFDVKTREVKCWSRRLNHRLCCSKQAGPIIRKY